MWRGLRSKKEPEEGERMVHGKGTAVSLEGAEDACVVVAQRKVVREK